VDIPVLTSDTALQNRVAYPCALFALKLGQGVGGTNFPAAFVAFVFSAVELPRKEHQKLEPGRLR
jgi:hypothetical protein